MKIKRQFRLLLLTIIFLVVTIPTLCSAGELNNFQQMLYPYTKTVFENGLTLIVKEVHTSPITAIDVWVGAGSINDPPELAGISHFLEHMLFKGTSKRPVGQIAKEIKGVGGYLGGSTTFDKTHYYVVVPSDYTDQALELEADVLMNSTIDQIEVDKERKVILEEWRLNQDEPQSSLYWSFYKSVFTGTPYANDILGAAETLNRINREQLLEYFRSFYRPENIVLTVTGDVDSVKVINRVRELFNDFKNKGPMPVRSFFKIPELKKVERVAIQKSVDQNYLLFGFPLPKLTIEESAAFNLLEIILGSGRSSRLYQELRETKQLVSTIDTGYISYDMVGVFIISAQTKDTSLTLIEKEIKSAIANLLKNGVTPEELNRAKAVIESELAYGLESNANIAAFLGVNELYGDLDEVVTELNAISKVTSEDIRTVARKYLNLKGYVFASVNPEGVKKNVK